MTLLCNDLHIPDSLVFHALYAIMQLRKQGVDSRVKDDKTLQRRGRLLADGAVGVIEALDERRLQLWQEGLEDYTDLWKTARGQGID